MPVDTNGGSDAHHHETGDEKVGENMDVYQLVDWRSPKSQVVGSSPTVRARYRMR